MIRGLDSAAAGMLVRVDQQDVITNNLANVNTPGYRRKVPTLSSFGSALKTAATTEDTPTASVVPTLRVSEDTRPGTMIRTGSTSDIALDGPGFFVLQTNGGEQQVRGGSFHLDSSGKLVSSHGYPVMGEKGTIQVSGDWSIDADGSVISGGAVVDKLRIDKGNGAEPEVPTRVISGSLEQSNVNTVQEMVSMITVMRAYESCQKTIQSLDQTLDKVINQMAK